GHIGSAVISMVRWRGTAPLKSTTPLMLPAAERSAVAAFAGGAVDGGAAEGAVPVDAATVEGCCCDGCDLQPKNASRNNRGSMFFIYTFRLFQPHRLGQPIS